MTTSVNQYQPVETGNGLDLPRIMRGSPDESGWAHSNNQTLTRLTCRCFLFYARKTPGFGGVWWFCAEKIQMEIRLTLIEISMIKPSHQPNMNIRRFHATIKKQIMYEMEILYYYTAYD